IRSKDFPSLVATTTNTKKPKLLLAAHMDVVPAEDDMFAMKITDGKLTGRGVFDMKFACASYMKVVESLGEKVKDYDFGIMLTFDEEVGGHNGVEALLEQGYGGNICLLPDSGTNWRLESTANGAWFIKVSHHGKNAHASLPTEGINASELLMDTLKDIIQVRENYSKDDLTLSVTTLDAGEAMNQIPDYAEAKIDIRYKDKPAFEKVKNQLETICQKHGSVLETIEFGHCMNVEIDHPRVLDFVNVAEEVLGQKIEYSHSTGATDARYLCAYDIPTIVIQPNGGGLHSDYEWVDAKGLKDLTEIILRFIDKCAIIKKQNYEENNQSLLV
ncbi:MAG TPA: M20/M25/M40 family metallo-hydrolase, partial [Patescibacteria group bacterium]|nr:M20/M25/M40 family metallo-hydrolase [Patescibacteria group bacterium]